MTTMTKLVSFLLPEEILVELNQSFSKSQQNKVVAEAIRKELKRLKIEKSLHASFGAWKNNNHPELQFGVKSYIRRIRKSSRLKSMH